jgi:PhnB protein
MRVLGLLKADEASEAGAPPDAELIHKMGDFIEEATNAGILLATDGLKPSSEGKRVSRSGGTVTVTDGPFTESKELVASYALMQFDSMDEAVHWTKRFLEVLGEGECELRPIFEATDFPPGVMPPEEAARDEALRQQMVRNAEAR